MFTERVFRNTTFPRNKLNSDSSDEIEYKIGLQDERTTLPTRLYPTPSTAAFSENSICSIKLEHRWSNFPQMLQYELELLKSFAISS